MTKTGLSNVMWLFMGAWMFLLFLVSGCAPLLIAGGAAGGYAVAKDMDDGQLIDDKKRQGI